MADGRHFENRYSSISHPQIVRISRNLVRRHKFYPRRRKVWQKNQKFSNSKWQTNAILKIIFLLIPRLHRARLIRNLQFGGIIARTRRLGDENVQFQKSNMAYGRHFEKSLYLHISAANRPNCTKLSMQTQILPQATESTKNHKFANSKWRMYATLKITIGYNSAACWYAPLRWNFEWLGRITRIHSRSGVSVVGVFLWGRFAPGVKSSLFLPPKTIFQWAE